MTAICRKIGSDLYAALTSFHAFTGSDYTSAFVRKGKLRPFKLLETEANWKNVFAMMASHEEISVATKESLMKFISRTYAGKKETGLNECRYKKFISAFGPKHNEKNLLSNLKGFDASGLPPCEAITHMKRASFIAEMWTNEFVQEHEEIEIFENEEENIASATSDEEESSDEDDLKHWCNERF